MDLLSIILLVFSFSLLASAAAQKAVSDLKADSLDAFMNTNKMGFVMFYSPDCKHCQSIEPVYEQSAKKVKENELDVVFGRIDGDKFPDAMSKYDVAEVPLILWFNSMRDHLVPYMGDTEMPSSFLSYIEEQIAFDTPEITFTQWKNMTGQMKFGSKSNSQNVLIFVGDKEKNMDDFNKIINAALNVFVREIYWTNDMEFNSFYNLGLEANNNTLNKVPFALLMFKIRNNQTFIDIFEKVQLTNEDLEGLPDSKFSSSSFKLENLLRLYSKELVNLFEYANERLIVLTIPTLILAHDYELSSPQYEEMINSLTKVASKYRREIFFMYGGPRTKFTQILTESYRLFVNDFPVLCMSSASESNPGIVEKYKKILTKDRVPTEEDLIQFIEDWKNLSLKPYVSSEAIPSVPFDENGIYKLVGDTFKKIVEAPGKDVVVVFCSDKLDVCTKFKEIFIRIARKLKNNEQLLIAEINPYSNEIGFSGYEHMPGIGVFPDNGSKVSSFKEYRGRMNTKDIIKFIKENVVHPILSEEGLPVEDLLSRNEEINEIKAINLEQKGMARKLFEKITDPDQKNLYKIPDKNIFKKEKEYLERKLDMVMQKRISLGSKDDL